MRLSPRSGLSGILRPDTGQQGVRATMDIVFHLGAHRTATTSLRHLAQARAAALAASGAAIWGPQVTRNGLLSGLQPMPGGDPVAAQAARASGRIALRLTQAQEAGLTRIVVSDGNMLGAPRTCLRRHRLYPDAGERVARLAHAFGGRITRAVLSIRAQDAWWASVLACAVARGHRLPSASDLDRVVTAGRRWRDVIADVAWTLPSAEIVVLPHEEFAGAPATRLAWITGLTDIGCGLGRAEWLSRRPDLDVLRRTVVGRGGDAGHLPKGRGRWEPFSAVQAAALKEAYEDDLFWLHAGADGLARLAGETGLSNAGGHPRDGHPTRGQEDGIEERHMA